MVSPNESCDSMSMSSMGILLGFDVSIFVNRVDWPTVVASTDYRFAFVECARGTEVGPRFSATWDTKPASFKFGPYQRLFSTASGKEQAQMFSDTVAAAGLLQTNLPPVLDVEDDPDGMRAAPGPVRGCDERVDNDSGPARPPASYAYGSFVLEVSWQRLSIRKAAVVDRTLRRRNARNSATLDQLCILAVPTTSSDRRHRQAGRS